MVGFAKTLFIKEYSLSANEYCAKLISNADYVYLEKCGYVSFIRWVKGLKSGEIGIYYLGDVDQAKFDDEENLKYIEIK